MRVVVINNMLFKTLTKYFLISFNLIVMKKQQFFTTLPNFVLVNVNVHHPKLFLYSTTHNSPTASNIANNSIAARIPPSVATFERYFIATILYAQRRSALILPVRCTLYTSIYYTASVVDHKAKLPLKSSLHRISS